MGSALDSPYEKDSCDDMARPLRIQFPDAWDHVMNRGKRGGKNTDKGNYCAFIDLLKDGVERNRMPGI